MVAAIALVACLSQRAPDDMSHAPSGDWTTSEVCGLPPKQLARILAGYRAGRSGDVQFVPRSPNYFGEHSHSGPWPYLQRVPLLLYGPGVVPVRGGIDRPVSVAQIASTLEAFLGTELGLPGSPLPVDPTGAGPPKLIVTIVWDGGGRDVLAEHPAAWPTLRRLRRAGVWFPRATVGSSPSVSPAVHASLSTGLPPARHGLVDMLFRHGGKMAAVQDDPRYLLAPTLADRYDRALGNRPLIALVGHPLILGMLGQGSAFPGGDRDVALIEGETGWNDPEGGARFFRTPDFAEDLGGLGAALDRLDRADGSPDGRWRDTLLSDLEASVTPAFAEHQTALVDQLIRRLGFGEDGVTDLLLLNYNQINEVGHHWSMNSPQMEDAVRSSDRALLGLTRVLDRRVGSGSWMVVVTADHGSTPDASVSGGFPIDQAELRRDLDAAFDGDGDGVDAVVEVRVTQLWVDHDELGENGFTPADVAWFLRGYTEADNRPGAPGEPVFAATFPSEALEEKQAC